MPTVHAHWQRRVRKETVSGCILSPEWPVLTAAAADGGKTKGAAGIALRVLDAGRRRARRSWLRFTGANRLPAAEAALAWLEQHGPAIGMAPCSGQFDPCPGLSGAVVGTAARFGQWELAQRLGDWLLSVQLPSGAMPDAGLRQPSLFNTSHAVLGLLALGDRSAAVSAARRGCEYLADQIDRHGNFAPSVDRGGAFEHWAPEVFQLAYLPALIAGGERFQQPLFRQLARHVLDRHRHLIHRTAWTGCLHLLTAAAEGLLSLGETELAAELLAAPRAAQRRNGAVPAQPGASWVTTTGQAHLAALWYQLGEHERADRATRWLTARQETSGGFLGSFGRGACYYPKRELAWTGRWFLEAARLQVSSSFTGGQGSVESDIADRDGRVLEIARWLASMSPTSRVADIGCGRGRYLAQLSTRFPAAQWTGIDLVDSFGAALPAGVERRTGEILHLPARAGEFDAAYSVEVLEHSLAPQAAVAELCRSVRAGGRVLIIDKNQAFRDLSLHQPWERWFTRDEVSRWLAAHCEQVRCVEVPHGTLEQPSGLFLCWTGVRRRTSYLSAAA